MSTRYTAEQYAALMASRSKRVPCAPKATDAPTPAPGASRACAANVEADSLPIARAALIEHKYDSKTEARYAQYLETQLLTGQIRAWWPHGITLRLGDDNRYTDDFVVLTLDGVIELHEVKGWMREASYSKMKAAANMYRLLFRFRLVKAVKGGGWDITEVKP